MLQVDLQERQTAAIQAMLLLSPRLSSQLPKQQNFLPHAAAGLKSSSSSTKDRCCSLLPPAAASWKILLFDNRAKDILAPLLTVGELRQQGVTLHLPLASARSPVLEAPAVFLVSPTEENVQQLLQELQRKLYAFYFFNFTQALPDHLMQLLAKGAVEAGMVSQVVAVVERYVDFVCLSPTIFSLNLPNIYSLLHSPGSTDSQVEAAVEAIAGGLFCVFATTGLLPIIKCPAAPSSPSRLVAIRLQEKIATLSPEQQAQIFPHIAAAATSAAASSAAMLNRPLLMLFDRDIDLSVMVRHTWLYQPLIHDLLDFRLNRVLVPVDDSSAAGAADQHLQAVAPPRVKTFHLENKDAFWRENCDACFPEAALAVSEALADYNSQLQRISSQQQQPNGGAAAADAGGLRVIRDPLSSETSSSSSTSSFSSSSSSSSSAATTQEILQAVSALPLLAEKKRSLDAHTCIATALVTQIRARGLDTFFEAEQQLDSDRAVDAVENVRRLLARTAPGTAVDKLRLLLALALAKPALPLQQLQSLEQMVQQDLGVSTAALQYLRQLQSFKALQEPGLGVGGVNNSSSGATAEASAVRGGAAAAAQVAATLSNKFFDKGKGLLLQGVRNLLPAKKVLPITQAVETLMNNREETGFLCIDPLRDVIATAQLHQSTAPLQRLPFRCGVAFVVGGASFVEAAALREAAARTQRQILYGSTDFPSPCDFVNELTELGKGETAAAAAGQ